MLGRLSRTASLVLVLAAVSSAADIQGIIVIKHKLTRRNVTPAAGAYDRGLPVKLEADPVGDPLAFERTHVVVFLEDGTSNDSATTAALEQRDRRFTPDLVVVPTGSTVAFPNFDPIFHNVFSLSKPKSFDLGNYPKGQSRSIAFTKPGIVHVNCHLHSNMTAVIVVTPNRWFARPDADGRFVIKDVPPGKHQVVAWHKTAGFFRDSVEPGKEVQFVIPLDESGHKSEPVATR